jgi:acyl transferase domain-containing protein
MTGLIAGSGGPSTSAMLAAHQTVLKTGATKRIGPFAVPKCMSSTVSANLATAYKIKGMNFSITSACSTSLHCIGMAAQQMACWASRTSCSRAAGRNWTGRCRASSTRWARCRPSSTTRPSAPRAPSTWIATGS